MKSQELIIAQVTPSTGPVLKTETAVAETPAMANKQDPMGAMYTMLMPLLILVGVYILFMRPQYKKEKQLRNSLKALTKGDRVITRGGIWGTVVGVKDPEGIVVLKIAEEVKVEVSKSAIEAINPQNEAAKNKPAEKSEKKK